MKVFHGRIHMPDAVSGILAEILFALFLCLSGCFACVLAALALRNL
jgi:hypothetical protein